MIRAAVLSSPTERLSPRHTAAFYLFRAELEAEFGFQFREFRSDAFCSQPSGRVSHDCDLIFYCFAGRDIETAREHLAGLRKTAAPPRIVLLDSADSTYARGFHLLPLVDLYLKDFLLRDTNRYSQRYLDGRIFSDFIIRRFRLPHQFQGSAFEAEPVREKAMVGWSYLLRERYVPYCVTPPALDDADRPIDVHCRIGTWKAVARSWLTLHRQTALEAVARLAPEAQVVSTTDRLPKPRYLQEIRQAKIVVSPFGWGEVCHRDHEAMANGALLIKPSMDHLETLPDLYRHRETYVAVDWALETLEETCRYYLEHDQERRRIAAAAWQCLTEHVRSRAFLLRMGEILHRLGLLEPAPRVSNGDSGFNDAPEAG